MSQKDSPELLREELYETMNDQNLTIPDKQHRALEIGLEYLGLENAYIQQLNDDLPYDEVVASVGEDPEVLPAGTELDRATTYCRRTVKSQSPIALSNASEQGWADDPAYEKHGFDCYLGTTIFVAGEVYGTICFISKDAQDAEFSSGEKEFVELLARLLGRAMEAAEYADIIETQKTAKEQSDNKYQSFLDLAPNAVFLAKAETGEIAEVNEQAAAMTGYSAAELKDMLILDLHPPEDEWRYRRLFESKPNDTSREWFDNGNRLHIRRKDGTDIPVEMSFNAIDLEGEPFIQGIVRDVSDRRDRIQRLERSREFIQQTQEAVDIGGWEYDLESEELRWTDEIYRIFDLELDADLSAEESFDFFHPDDRSTIKHAFGRLTEKGEPYDLELRIITAAGTERWVRSIGRPRYDDTGEELVAVLGVFRDITERKERQRDLRLRSEAMEESTVGITIADAERPDVPIIYANQGFTELTGYSKEYLVGKNCRFLQGEGTDQATIANIREAIKAEEPIRVQILNYRSDGTPFWNKLTIAPVTGVDDDEVTHFVGVQDDITAQKRRDRLIQILNRVLRHNLRNDMNKVGGVANMIAAETDGEVADMAAQISDTADELTRLSEKAQEFESAVADSEQLAPQDITADLEAVVSELRQQYPDVSFTIESDGSSEVMATERIRLALHELGENAAMHGNGSDVTYRLSVSEDEGVEIAVIDSGPGLPTQEQQVLSAGRETPLAHGSGLGLWLVSWVVSGLGGEVTATVDGGTTVTMTFPERNIESSESNMAGWNAALSTEQ